MKRLTLYEPIDFDDSQTTERGERVYKHLRIELQVPGVPNPMIRVIACEKGIGITEEWIQETIDGCLKSLEKDFPTDTYKVVRLAPNDIKLEYQGTRGLVN